MKRIIIVTFALLLTAVILLVGCGNSSSTTTSTSTSTSSPSTVKPITLKVSHNQPPPSQMAISIVNWTKEVTKRTNGQIQFEIYPFNTLFPASAAIDSTTSNVADIAMFAFGDFGKRLPISQLTAVPNLGFPNTAEGMLAAEFTFKTLIDKQYLANEFKDFKFLWYSHTESSSFYSKNAIHVPADCKGVKIGAAGIKLQTVAALGGVPVNVIPTEAYQNMQTGVTSGQLMSWNIANDFKMWEVSKYVVEYDFGQAGYPVIMNLNTWNKLSPEVQKIMMDVNAEEMKAFHKASADSRNAAIQAGKTNGMTLYTPTGAEKAQWDTAIKVIEDQWLTTAKEAGVANAQAILNDWKAGLAKFNQSK